jgi:hypothetical protein
VLASFEFITRPSGRPFGGAERQIEFSITGGNDETTSDRTYFSAARRARGVCRRAISARTRHRLLGQRRRRLRPMDASAYLFHRSAPSGRPLRGRSPPDSLRQQSDAAGCDAARGRYGVGGRQPQSCPPRWPNRGGTERARRRSILRDQAAGVKLGAPESLFYVRPRFAAEFPDDGPVTSNCRSGPTGCADYSTQRRTAAKVVEIRAVTPNLFFVSIPNPESESIRGSYESDASVGCRGSRSAFCFRG